MRRKGSASFLAKAAVEVAHEGNQGDRVHAVDGDDGKLEHRRAKFEPLVVDGHANGAEPRHDSPQWRNVEDEPPQPSAVAALEQSVATQQRFNALNEEPRFEHAKCSIQPGDCKVDAKPWRGWCG